MRSPSGKLLPDLVQEFHNTETDSDSSTEKASTLTRSLESLNEKIPTKFGRRTYS